MKTKYLKLTFVLFLMSSAALNAQTPKKTAPADLTAKRNAENEAHIAQQKADAEAKAAADKIDATDKAAAAQIYELLVMADINRFMANKLTPPATSETSIKNSIPTKPTSTTKPTPAELTNRLTPADKKMIDKINTFLNTTITAESMNSTYSDAEINTLSAYVVNTKGAQKNNFTKFSGTNFSADAEAVAVLDKTYLDMQNAINKRKAYLKNTTYQSIFSKAKIAIN
jgi:hypothetical protein